MNCVGFEYHFKSVTEAKFEPSVVKFLIIMPKTESSLTLSRVRQGSNSGRGPLFVLEIRG